MPLYEYQCDACGHRFEKIQKFSDPLEDTCPKCAGHVHKLVSSPAIQFKGSGFYITDYPKGDKGSAPKSDGGKADLAEKAEKPDTAKSEKTDKADKSEKTDTSPKADVSTKSDKASTDSSSSKVSSAPATPASPASSAPTKA
jgi:putative FmdB family regulatory protein